jgi:hypothetical protein
MAAAGDDWFELNVPGARRHALRYEVNGGLRVRPGSRFNPDDGTRPAR